MWPLRMMRMLTSEFQDLNNTCTISDMNFCLLWDVCLEKGIRAVSVAWTITIVSSYMSSAIINNASWRIMSLSLQGTQIPRPDFGLEVRELTSQFQTKHRFARFLVLPPFLSRATRSNREFSTEGNYSSSKASASPRLHHPAS